MSVQLIYVPVPSLEAADTLSRGLLLGRLAACVNVLPGMRSTYMWEGSLTVDEECLLLVKTTAALADAAAEWLAEHHPYDTPCVLKLPAASANACFGAWVEAQVSRSAAGDSEEP